MKGLMVHKVCVLMTFMKYNKSFAFYKRLKVINTLKKKTVSTVRSSSVVYDGNLHTTWFCSINLFPRGNVSQ